MDVLEQHSGGDSTGPLFDCTGVSLNFSNVLFGSRGVHNNIFVGSSIVLSNSMSVRTVCTTMLLME